MARSVKLSRLEAEFERLTYPATRESVLDELGDLRIELADGETTVAEVVSRTGSERFHGPSELAEELYGALPIEAIGEPNQSEGDA